MKTITTLVLISLLLFAGCRTFKPEYSLFKSDHEERIDELWRQGYGYNNPNNDRLRNGQDPLNFDGEPNTFESAAEDIGSRAIGNVVAFVIFEGVPALFRGVTNKFRR